jgi:hypothetical protein
MRLTTMLGGGQEEAMSPNRKRHGSGMLLTVYDVHEGFGYRFLQDAAQHGA